MRSPIPSVHSFMFNYHHIPFSFNYNICSLIIIYFLMSETSTFTNSAINSVSNDNTDRLYLDVPDFQLTKYNSVGWIFLHLLTYSSFAVSFLIIPLYEIQVESNPQLSSLTLFATVCLLMSSLIEWSHYTRGCIAPSNLNTVIKSNIDQSCYAKLMRMKTGIVYFAFVIGSSVLLCGCVLKEKNLSISKYFILAAMVILAVVSVFKVDLVVSPTKQYACLNDLSNVFVHFLFLMGTLFFGLGSLLHLLLDELELNSDAQNIRLYLYIQSIGGFLYLLSSVFLYYRYCCSGREDLNLDSEFSATNNE